MLTLSQILIVIVLGAVLGIVLASYTASRSGVSVRRSNGRNTP